MVSQTIILFADFVHKFNYFFVLSRKMEMNIYEINSDFTLSVSSFFHYY